MPLSHPRPLRLDGLSILNPEPKRLPGPCFLHELVSLSSNDDDGLLAAIDFLSENGQRIILSYSELHAASLALAYSISCILRSAPSPFTATSETQNPLIIPILSPQSPQLYVAILAALKAGGAFCPLNADAPPERVKFILQDVKAKIVLASRDLASKLPTDDDESYRIIFIDDVLDAPEARRHDSATHHELQPEDFAYVMYTSGSTGTPKGVAVSHLAATQSILAHQRHIPPFSRFLQFAAPIFDVSIFEIFFPLFRGATLVGCNRAEMLTDLVGVLKRMHVDGCELTPSVAGSLLRQRSRAPDLRLLLTIGEMLTQPVVHEFGGDESKMSILWGMYGPTEATIHCTVEANFAATSKRSKIGVPFDTVSAFVIRLPTDSGGTSQFEVLPTGEVGELALGGLQLASCYLNRPQQTATSFVDTSWGRVYRTGDKAKIHPDGTIECLGRIDESQVKLNGQRLELGEVEQVLLRTPGCHSAVAAVVSNTLVAFAAVEPVPNAHTQLWAQCRSWLPAFMVPADIVVMGQLHQLPSGKLDRKRLVEEYVAQATIVVGEEEAVDDYERLFCEIATAILGERVGPLTEFSAAKLDSLAAIEYSSTLRERGISITPVDILSIKTPRELRQRIQDDGALAASPVSQHWPTRRQSFDHYLDTGKLQPALGDRIDEIDRIEKPTSLQQSMIAETLKDADLYINQVEIALTSTVALDVLQSSLRELAKRNEVLRTGFAFVECQLCQVIWKQLDDAQLHDNVDGRNSVGEVQDVELFLLRPLKIEIRRHSPDTKYFALLLTLHHAIYDGWTVDLMIEDLSLLLSGKLPPKRPQFSQIMRHLRHAVGVNSTDSMEFWTEHLRGIGAITALNFRTIAVSQPQRVTTIKKVPLHPKVLQGLMSGVLVGPQVLFQACLVWLWATVQGTHDVVIGCVSSGRSLPIAGIDKLMGPCMTTLPLRINISRYRTITELLQNIHSINRETLRHGHIPLSEINKAAGLSAPSKLFDVIFAYQESPISRKKPSNILREAWHRDATEAKLVIEIQPCQDHFICQATFNTGTLPQSLAEAFVSHLSILVDYFSGHVDAPVETIPQCFPLKNLSHFNDNPRSIETYFSLPEMVEASVSKFPAAAALYFATSINSSAVNYRVLSYHDLNAKANQIARYLQQYSLNPGCPIAIVMNKSPLLYCSILGILKTGCAYLPILPSTPFERVKVILDQAEPCLCVVDEMSSSLIHDREWPKIINMEAAVLSPWSNINLDIRGRPSDLAYVIYTSGTTGTPKGVAVTNKNILSNISILSGIYPHDHSNRMLQACSQAFDVSVFEIFFAWANGMCLCAATNDTLFEDFEYAVGALEITHLSLTVTVASLLNPENVPTVKFLVTSGEPMTDEVLDKWSHHLYQGYGPSETTNICTVRKVSRGDSSQFLGWSFENTSTFVLDPNYTHLVPVGCIGELCFGGDQVASGYLKLLEATNAKFIEHASYGRLYRSGDLGCMLPDGSLIIHGRIDTQVKLRGLRIELQEIQEIALKTGFVRACKSILFAHEKAKLQQLALFYAPVGNQNARFQLMPLTNSSQEQVQTLRYALQSCLPDYMVPVFIFPISTLPLTSSGKVDERTLRSSVDKLSVRVLNAYSSTEDQAGVQSEWSETETLITNIIMDMLKKDRNEISRWTTFSALGLDSISAMPVARKLQTVLGKRVPLSLLFQNPSVNRLASAIDETKGPEQPEYSNAPLLPEELVETLRKRFTAHGRSVAKALPCTPLQEAMVMSSLNSSSTILDNGVAYYNQMLFHLHIPFQTIIDFWNEIIRRHEILRAIFIGSDDIRYPAIQMILDNYIPKWQVLETDDASLQERAYQHIASTSAVTDYDTPPMALAIIRTRESGDYLSFVCHHAMYDGISMRIILSEIESLYHGRQLAEPPSLEPFLREIQLSHPDQDNFWKQLLLGFQPTPLRCKDFTKDTMPRTMSAKASEMSLKFIGSQLRDIGVSMLALIQTAWAITLSILSQKSDVSFGNVIAGRSISLDMVDNLVAPCFNTLPIRMDLSLSTFIIDVMKGFQSLNSEIMPYQFTGLRHIQKEVDAQTRLFDTLVILQPSTTPLDDRLWSLVYEDGYMDVPIVCEVIPSDLQDTLTIQLHRDKSKFPYQILQLIGKIFSHVLDICLRYPFSHIFASEGLPADWQTDIRRLFHRSEDLQTSNGPLNETLDYEEAWSLLELAIRQTLAKLAEIPEDQINRLTPIYRYGLDSIAAIQLANLLRQQNIQVSAIDVIEHPTCAGIAAAVKNSVEASAFGGYDFTSFQKQVEREIPGFEINPKTVEVILPCTATQQGLLSQFLESKGRHYFNYSSWVFNIATSLETITWALTQLTNCHQILRTGFIPVNHPDSSFAMLVYNINRFTIPVEFYHSDAFDIEDWLSHSTTDALDTLARPPWRLALVTSKTGNSEISPTIHLAIHHALYDAFTLRNLLQDLGELISHGNRPKIPSIDHALSHYFSLVQSSQSAGERFWKQRADTFVFHKFPSMTPLHIDNFDTLTVSHTCQSSSSLLRQAASKAGITVQAALQAALTRLLSAYIGESRVTFGVVLDGRNTDLARKATLPMITTLPVIAENVALNYDLVQQMMQYNTQLRRFQFMPMADIQRLLRNTGTMFDTILIYQAADKSMKPPPVHVIKELASVEYPISLEVEETFSNTTRLNLAFRVNILPQEQATLLLSQFEAILMDLLVPVQNPLSHLASSKAGLFSILPPSCESIPIGAELLHELLEHSATLLPSTAALEFVEDVAQFSSPRIWTYQELDALGNQVAHFITRHGVAPGSIIATCFNKCPVAYFTLLGILKAGCAFLCLDPSAPATRQTFILEDSKAAMLMLCESFDWAGKASFPVHIINETILEPLPTSSPSLQRPVLPTDSCYCLYTSGTTGTPKGCLMSHENVVQAMAAFEYLFAGRWDSDSRWLQFAAYHFDVSVLEQYWSWYVGIAVIAAPKDVILSDLAMTVSKLRITHIDLTPSLARLINPDECPSLCKGVFITGGEKLRADILKTWGSKRVIHNAYGPTETTIGITMNRGVPENGKPSNIGNLFPNVGAYITQRNSEIPVLRGGVGELCVSGKLVGQGYLNREALTRERFPVFQTSGDRFYRTGDLVRVLHDDSLDFLGRADDQVKLRGQRLEIGEINHAIREGLGNKVGDIATMVTRRKGQDVDLLVSFVALSFDSGPAPEIQIYYDASHLEVVGLAQEACRSRLATYMVPSFIICVSRIPLSTNNKVDVNYLKKLFSELSNDELQALSMPSLPGRRLLNKLESEVLEAIYQVVLVQEKDIIPSTTIFQLGIDSITATRLARQLRAMGLSSATPSIILQNPQIDQLSQALGRPNPNILSNALQVKQSIKALRHRYLSLVCRTLEVKTTEVEYIAPCTPLQQGIIARSKTREAQLAYFNQFKLSLDYDVSIPRLKAALGRVIASYSILRTGFVDTPDGFLQVAIKDRLLRWFKVKSDTESFEQITAERQRRWIEENHLVLRWPVEVDHIELGGQHHLLLRLFHGVYDARSLDIILHSLGSEYKGISQPVGPTFISVLPEGPLLNHEESHRFWKTLLKKHRFQPMPSLIDKPTAIRSLIQRSVKFEGLEDRRRKLQVTHQTLLQVAWLHTLRQYFVNPPTIGVILSGRSLAIDDVDLVVGPLFNTLPLRVDFSNDMSWAMLTQEVQAHNNGLLRFVHTPLRDIQKFCAHGQPLFDTLFTFDRDHKTTTDSERALWSIEDSPAHSDYPLAIEIILVGDKMLHITLAAQGRIGNNPALNSLLDEFVKSLNSIIAPIDDVFLPSVVRTVQSETNKQLSTPVPEFGSANGYTVVPKTQFQWDERSNNVRRELAVIAKVDEQEISETTNLFALGLDSIDVIKLAGRLTKLGYNNVSVGTLMKQPTLENIAASLENLLPLATNPAITTELDKIISGLKVCYDRTSLNFPDVEAILPPSPLQDSMVAEMLRSEFCTYFNHDVLELPPETDFDRLQSALSTVYAGSPILRTVFVEVDDPGINSAYFQVVRKHEFEFTPILKISNEDEISTLTEMARMRALESIGTQNLFQVHFAEFGSRKFIILSIAHALYDGWSLHMLHKDIQAAYKGSYIPRQSYESYLTRMLFQPNSPSQQFWADLLNGSHATLVPKAITAPRNDTVHRLEKRSKRSSSDIRAVCMNLRVTPQVLGQACWAAVLASLTKSLDVVFGVVLSGRDTEEAQGLMFPTMNTVPLRLALHGTVAEFLDYAQDIMSGVIEFQHTPLRNIQKLTRSHRDGLFNTIFLLQNSTDNNADDSPFLKSTHSISAVDYPLCAELELEGNDASWRIACDSSHMNSQEVDNLGVSLEKVLDYFAQDANRQVLSFSSHDSQIVSICGLELVSFESELQPQEGDISITENTSQQPIFPSQEYDILLGVLSDLSGVGRHEIDTRLSIFHIGLDSISAIKASLMLRKRGLHISTRDLVTIPSIHEILEQANRENSKESKLSTEDSLRLSSTIDGKEISALIRQFGFDANSIETILPALPMQFYMLSVWQNSGGTIFFPKFSFKISGSINPRTISKAWVALVDEIAMLRTHMIGTTSPSHPFLQVILKSEFTRKHATSITTESKGRWEFVYTATPLAIVQFVGEQLGEAHLNLFIHHALYDGISLPIILDRFAELCNSTSPTTSPVLGSPWYQFALKHLASPVQAQRQSFWTSYLSQNTAVQLYQARQSLTAVQDPRVNEFRRTTINNTAGLRARGSMHGITTQAIIYAAYAKAFSKWLRQERHLVDNADFIFGIYLANRPAYPGIEEAPFPTLNILPLRIKDPLSRSITDMAVDIRKDITEISKFENSTANLWEIQRWTGICINTFVNILSRPDNQPLVEPKPVTLDKTLDHESPPTGSADISRYLASPDSKIIFPNATTNPYPEGIDIELALHNDVLDIGVFGPSNILSTSQASDMITAILAEVETL
ncbi:putative non-ribosomal peptide synthetase [Hypoxylon argillaceum]|nr:putative non-ribosomal peptide synthetase [Hypoxylon argillaceum]